MGFDISTLLDWKFIVPVLVFLFLLIFFTNYRKVPPNIALVISGCIRRR